MPLDPNSLPELDTALRKLARRLVVDAAKADDVVQDAWLVALRRDDGTVASWAAWLSGTVRRLTGEARRAQERRSRRESAVALLERVPSTAEFVEREAMRRQLMDALFGLPEMYRIALALRFLDDLTPREVAAKLEVPLETARTRIKRGVEMLRERLDADFGCDRRAWGVALAPLAVPHSHAVGAALTTAAEVLLMNVAMKAALVGAALCCVTWVVLTMSDAPARSTEAAATPTTVQAIDERGAQARDPSIESEVATTRRAADPATAAATPAAAVASTGALELTIRYADGTPGAGVGIAVTCYGAANAYRAPRRSTADEKGAARFTDLAAGSGDIQLDRGTNARCTIVAGETTRLAIEIVPGAAIEGVVLTPERNPVAGASIFLSLNGPEADGFIVARTGADGTFALRDVTNMHLVGARAPGYAPSELPFVMCNRGAKHRFELVLRARGSSIVGRVLDLDGKPIAQAVVEATEPRTGTNQAKFDDAMGGYRTIGQRARTDANGSFLFEGVTAGVAQTLLVRSEGYAIVATTLTADEGARVTSEIRLPPSPTLRGRVVDARGNPAAATMVRIGSVPELDAGQVMTDVRGEFAFDTLPTGAVTLVARANTTQTVRQRVDLVAGATTETTIALPASLRIRGRVVDSAGAPCREFTVTARPVEPIDVALINDEVRSALTAADGTFVLQACRDAAYDLEVLHPDAVDAIGVTRSGVRPSDDDVVLVFESSALPTGGFTLCVVDVVGVPVGGAMVVAYRDGLGVAQMEASDPDTGCVAMSRLVPGTYSVVIQAPGNAPVTLPARAIGANEIAEYGAITVAPGGSLFVTVRGAVDATAASHAFLVGETPMLRHTLEPGDAPGSFVRKDLAPGRWTLIVDTPGAFVEPMIVEIASERETHVELPVEAGVAVELVLTGLANTSHVVQPYCRVFAADGRLMIDRMAWRTEAGDAQRYFVTLPKGDYIARARAVDDDGETAFTVGDEATSVEIALH